ncbi:MAG: hypothetical protein IJU23_11480 [Proteobacteria bacterium]|nr:hypothetical protein [Pseudomonadota bacterium]
MKKYILSLSLLLCSLILISCDSTTSVCSNNDDCASFCNVYDGNQVLYACNQGTCSCVAYEYMQCTGDAESDHCEEICNQFRPGTMAVCEASFCECREKECAVAADCEAKCAGSAMKACSSYACQCLAAEALACSGDGAEAYCANLCNTYEPGALSACANGTCECKSTVCTNDNDCNTLCASVGAAMTSCLEGHCQCIAKESLACNGDDAAARCTKICQKYKPNTLAVCESGYCSCSEL